jgi:HEAT repeat protein
MATREEIRALMEGDEFPGLAELLDLGEAAADHLAAFARDKSQPAYIRQRALIALGEMGADQGEAAMIENLTDDHPVQRLTAVRALTQLRGADAGRHLTRLLADDDVSVRKTALRCLGETGDPSVLPALEKMADQETEDFLKTEARLAANRIHRRGEGKA